MKLFGIEVDASNHPHAWAAVSLVCFVLLALLVADLRRSRTGRRLDRGAHQRASRRVARHLCVRGEALRLAVSAGLAAVAGILVAFRGQVITYTEFNVFASINSLGHAVIGGLGFVLGAVFGGPNAIGGFGTRIVEDWVSLEDRWDLILGSLVVFLILIFHQNGIADVATAHGRGLWEKLRLVRRRDGARPCPWPKSSQWREPHCRSRS